MARRTTQYFGEFALTGAPAVQSARERRSGVFSVGLYAAI